MDKKVTPKAADTKDLKETKENKEDTEREIKPEDAKNVAGGRAHIPYE